jgi:hypothetical protein
MNAMRTGNPNNAEPGSAICRNQLLTIGDLEKFKNELLQEMKNLLKDSNGQAAKQWLKSSEVRKLLGISPGTLQNLRTNGTLSYTKIGGIVFYRYEEIAKLLNSQNSK